MLVRFCISGETRDIPRADAEVLIQRGLALAVRQSDATTDRHPRVERATATPAGIERAVAIPR